MNRQIDANELIKRIMSIDPFWYSGVAIKWKIIKIVKQMIKEQINDTKTQNE